MGPHFGGICPQSCPSTDSWVVSPKRCYAPQTLNRIAECFQCLPEDTKMRVLSQLLTTGVNLPSADIEAVPGGLPRRLPEQNIIEEVICEYQQQLVTIKW